MVERSRYQNIWRLKDRMRKLEAKCRRVLSVSSQSPVAAEEKTADTEERRDGTEDGTAATGAAATAAKEKRRAKKLPTLLTKMQPYQRYLDSDSFTETPADLEEAQAFNYQLKVQFLKLQTTMLRWGIKNKKIHDSALKEVEQKQERFKKKTASGARLRELLRLETAVKSVFSPSQIKVITRLHGGKGSSTAGDPPAKPSGGAHWDEDDLRRVLELRAISSDRAVSYVREKLKVPLPTMAAVKLRCAKSPELNEAYKVMLAEREERQKRCDACDRQLNTIDEVIEAAADQLAEEDAALGRQYLQFAPAAAAAAGSAGAGRCRVSAEEAAAARSDSRVGGKEEGTHVCGAVFPRLAADVLG